MDDCRDDDPESREITFYAGRFIDVAETEAEKKLYDGALRRRQLRLILGGKMKAADADELKALFF